MELNLTDQDGNSALHLLAKMEISPLVVQCLNLLIKKGAIDPKLKNKIGKTAADIIRSRSDERKTLLESYEKSFGELSSKSKKKKKKKKKKKAEEVKIIKMMINLVRI